MVGLHTQPTHNPHTHNPHTHTTHTHTTHTQVAIPNMAVRVIDRAIQVHGGAGVSQDFPLAYAWISARSLRIADGPDEVISLHFTFRLAIFVFDIEC